ncbi:MAG: hypothetical protein NWQ37_04290, partial [Marivita lacus]|nr:hypothetical protein [Marivita lacus]
TNLSETQQFHGLSLPFDFRAIRHQTSRKSRAKARFRGPRKAFCAANRNAVSIRTLVRADRGEGRFALPDAVEPLNLAELSGKRAHAAVSVLNCPAYTPVENSMTRACDQKEARR